MWARQQACGHCSSTWYLCGNRDGDRVSSSAAWTTLAWRRGIGITKCAWRKPLARQIKAIQLPGEGGHITWRMKWLESGVLTQEGSHRVPKSAWWVAVSRTEPIHHAVHRTSHWALLQITRRAPSLRWRGMDYMILRPWLRPTEVPPSHRSILGIIQSEWMHIYNNLKTQVHENTNTDIIVYKERCIHVMRSRSRDFGHCCHWSHFDVLSPL